jgi:DNA end-binding protein Ku
MVYRPTWRGHLRLSLVSCPVALYTATNPRGDVHFNLINPKTNNRIRMVTTDPDTGPIERSELARGYEVDKGQYILLTDEEIHSVKLESTKTIDIERFIDEDDIDRIYWDNPYYLAPDGKMAQEAFAVIREAMERAGQIALGRIVLSTRERLLALEPRGKGLLATSLRTKDEVRDAHEVFAAIDAAKPDAGMIAIAEKIIEQKKSEFDPARFNDRYEEALRALIDQKLKGHKPVAAAEPEDTNVVDLMSALRASLAKRPKAESGAKADRGAKDERRARPAGRSSRPAAKSPRRRAG